MFMRQKKVFISIYVYLVYLVYLKDNSYSPNDFQIYNFCISAKNMYICEFTDAGGNKKGAYAPNWI